MPNDYFQFKQFTIYQDRCAMKVSTEACVLGAWFAHQKTDASYILDVGSGTGLLMLMLAQKWPGIVHGIEIDPIAAGQLAENIERSPWRERTVSFEGDIRNYPFPVVYDFIISNPPFYEQQLPSGDPAINLARHSSSLTLDELILSIDRNLSAKGSFSIILPVDRAIIFEQKATEKDFHLLRKMDIQHSPEHKIFRTILHMGRERKNETIKMVLDIRDQNGNYSTDFIHLMKDYYLYL